MAHLRIDLFLLVTLLLLGYSSTYVVNFDDERVSFPWIDMPETSIYRSTVDPWRRDRLLKSLRIQSISPEDISNAKRYASQAFHAMRG